MGEKLRLAVPKGEIGTGKWLLMQDRWNVRDILEISSVGTYRQDGIDILFVNYLSDIETIALWPRDIAAQLRDGSVDAEGSINFTGSRSITISSQSIIWINKLQKILDTLKIKSKVYKEEKSRYKPIYRLTIHHIINLKRFYRIIKPVHNVRNEKLRKIIIEFDKNPSKIFHKKILLSIQSGNNRRRDIAKDINKNIIFVSNNIAYLKKKCFICSFEKVYTSKGCYFKYKITDKGIKYIEEGDSYFF